MGNIGIGPDGRMYVSSRLSGFAWQVINYPDKKGDSCGFCIRCERPTSSVDVHIINGGFVKYNFMEGLPNIPNFNLDGSNPNCWPLGLVEALVQDIAMQILPNPAMETFIVDKVSANNIQLLNMLGQVMQVQTVTNNKATFNVGAYARGVYFVKADGQVLRVVLQ
jgi:Secretion system C-terminal sorting domain